MSTKPLRERAQTEAVENVLIFVSDALRFDFLPAAVRQRGITARAIAPSTFTASALPSLLTGLYPASHKVWRFDDQLPEQPALLADDGRDVGFDASTVWIELPSHEKPPLQIHRVETESTLADLEPPFTHVIHDVGPHAPYGFENDAFESTKEFFREYENEQPELVDLYRQDCQHSAERFLDVYEQLADRGLLESTLVVFTSDHGQALGERRNGGRFGHGHPMCPEVVSIPIVFMGAGLPQDETYDSLLSGTDIAPTALAAQGASYRDVDGHDVWRRSPPADRKLRSDVWQHVNLDRAGLSREVTVYAATSAWNEHGGYVFHLDSRVERCASIAFDNVFRGYAPAWRENASLTDIITMMGIGLSETLSFDTPDFSVDAAEQSTPDSFSKRSTADEAVTLSTEQEEQLRNLGYL